MHALSVRLSSKRLYIADLAGRLEAMESGRTAMKNANAQRQIAYRAIERRLNPASWSRRAGNRMISPMTRPTARRAGAGSMTRRW